VLWVRILQKSLIISVSNAIIFFNIFLDTNRGIRRIHANSNHRFPLQTLQHVLQARFGAMDYFSFRHFNVSSAEWCEGRTFVRTWSYVVVFQRVRYFYLCSY
jgi:hypothetical protein